MYHSIHVKLKTNKHAMKIFTKLNSNNNDLAYLRLKTLKLAESEFNTQLGLKLSAQLYVKKVHIPSVNDVNKEAVQLIFMLHQ